MVFRRAGEKREKNLRKNVTFSVFWRLELWIAGPVLEKSMARDGISLRNSGMRGVEEALSGLYAVHSHSGRFIDFFLAFARFLLNMVCGSESRVLCLPGRHLLAGSRRVLRAKSIDLQVFRPGQGCFVERATYTKEEGWI
jgi:hypothetical protein